ncbi:MAG: hypothetical protein Q9226_005930 [Calogaya cf. arnoldii]
MARREILIAFADSWTTVLDQYYLLDAIQCTYRLISLREQRKRHRSLICPMQETFRSIAQLKRVIFDYATEGPLSQLQQSWFGLRSIFGSNKPLRDETGTLIRFWEQYKQCYHTYKALVLSFKSFEEKSSATSGGNIVRGPLLQYLVREASKEQRGEETISDINSQEYPEEGESAELTKIQGPRDVPIQYLHDEKDGTESISPNFVKSWAHRPWPTHPLFPPSQASSSSPEGNLVGRQRSAAFHTCMNANMRLVSITTAANHTGPEKLHETRYDEGSIARREIESAFGSHIPSNRMRDGMPVFTAYKPAWNLHDPGVQYKEQRGNGFWGCRENIKNGVSQDQRTWQPSKGMHFSTSTSAPGSFWQPSRSSDNYPNAKRTPSAILPKGFPITRRCVSSSSSCMQSPYKSEQPPPPNLESMDAKDRSLGLDYDRPLRSWPSSPKVRPHFCPGYSYKVSKVARPTRAAFHTSARASGSSSAPDEEIPTVDRSRSGEDVLGDDSDMARHQLSGPLGYQIPSHKMRESMLTSESSRSAYWQYTLYEGPQGQKVKVHYCKSLETTERIAQLFLNESVIGFDIEWKPSATARDGIRKNVALIQLASEERIALFHIARFSKDDSIESLVAPTFKAIMESSSITKVGVSVKGDCTRLRNHMNIDSHGLFELSHLHRLVKFSLTDVKQINRKLVALAKQVEEHLMLPMSKDESVRGSDWSQDLNYQQISYAASDSYAGFQLYHILNNKRLALSPCPPLPAHAELGLPIRLANGQTVAEYEEPTQEEAAPEESNGNTTPQPSTEELDEAAMNLEIEDNEPSSSTAQKPGAPKPKAKPRACPSHPSIIAANDWITEYRASTQPPSSSNDATYPTLPSATTTPIPSSPPPTQKKPRATPASLRAYFLFHHHALSVADIASLLRDPPLLHATVASYILEAARIDRLELQRERIELCLEVLPESGRVRYRWLGKR